MRLKITAPSSLLSVVLDREITEQQADAVKALLAEPEWCLHCGSDTCEHAVRHNSAYGAEAPFGAGDAVEAFRG